MVENNYKGDNMTIRDQTSRKARRHGIIFLHDCEDCKNSQDGKCTITGEDNIRSTDCINFEWK